MKSRIMELLNNEKSVVVFDIDGVLAAYEDGEYNHNACRDEDWPEYIKANNVYEYTRPIKTIQRFIDQYVNPERAFVCSVSKSEIEESQKVKFIKKHYNIPEDHIFMVRHRNGKLDVLRKIHTELFPDIMERQVIMVDDTSDVLSNIQDNSSYSTVHISSFIE